MDPGDRIVFTGPIYKHSDRPFIGQEGVVTKREGHKCQLAGEEEQELVTVHFDGDEQDSVISINRITRK